MRPNFSSLAVEIAVKRGITFLQAKLEKVLLRDAYLYWLNLVSLAKTFSSPFARFLRRAMSGLIAFAVGCATLAYGYDRRYSHLLRFVSQKKSTKKSIKKINDFKFITSKKFYLKKFGI